MAISMEDVGMMKAYEGMWSNNQPVYVKDHHGHSGERATALGFGIAGLAVAVVGVAAVWGLSNSRTNDLKDMLLLQAQNLQAESNARLMGDTTERGERLNQATTLDNKITITSNTASTAASAANAINTLEQNALLGLVDGSYNRCPQKVTLWSETPCPCPASNCGCNG